MKIGFLYKILRVEEKLLLQEFRERGIEPVKINDDNFYFELGKSESSLEIVLERSVSHSRAKDILKWFNTNSIRTINKYETANICGDKFLTSIELEKKRIPTPRTLMAYTEGSALKAIDEIGYPCVIKPPIGSWGRMIAKINDRECAEAILEHKSVLGKFDDSRFYIQEYIEKPGRDIRVFFIGGKAVAAVYRNSSHWKTNIALGGKAENCPVTKEIDFLCQRAAEAVLGEILGIDIFESNRGLLVNEINYTTEFRNSIKATGVNIPKEIVNYTVNQII